MVNLLSFSNYHHRNAPVNLHKGLYTFLNPYSYIIARKDPRVFSSFDRVYFDGVAILKLASFLGIVRSERLSFDMTSLAPRVFSLCENEGKTVFFIGATANQIYKAVTVLQDSFPSLRIVGFRHGYFENSSEMQAVQNEIRTLNPDVVVAGLGTPLQEQFLLELRACGWNGVGFTCGGFFHQTASRGTQYYPNWINKLHLRWAYRMYDEPRLIKRYLFQYPLFVLLFLKDFFANRWQQSGY